MREVDRIGGGEISTKKREWGIKLVPFVISELSLLFHMNPQFLYRLEYGKMLKWKMHGEYH